MILIELGGVPVPWRAHSGYGRKSFNPLYKERACAQWQIKAQYNQGEPICGPVRLDFAFHMPIPKSTSKIRTLQMLNGVLHHISRPDTSNLVKFAEDCLKELVFEDDSQVVEIVARKIYGATPKTVIRIEKV